MTSLEEAVGTLNLNSALDVRDLLLKEEIKGVPIRIHECPLAVYLSRVTGEPVYVGVSSATPVKGATVPLPPAACQFRSFFDMSHHWSTSPIWHWRTRKLRA